MPASVPIVRTPKLTRLKDEVKQGYSVLDGRWEGGEFQTNAVVAAFWLRSQFDKTGVIEGKASRWVSGKHVDYKYYKVYAIHPKYPDLYAWWVPGLDEFNAPFNMERATWFELQDKK